MRSITLFLFCLSLSMTAFSHESGTIDWFDEKMEQLLKLDGNEAEELDVILGNTIKSHPTNFLKTVVKYEGKIKRLDSLLANLGEEFVDQEKKSLEEIEKRSTALKKAISRSRDLELKRVGVRCVSELNKFLKH
jgi:hypothetical protein